MAAPATKTITDLNGSWVVNSQISDSPEAILKLQGVNWLMRKVVSMATLTLIVDQNVDDDTGYTHLNIENKSNNGMPGAMERRVLDETPVELNHTLLGSIRGRSKYCTLAELEEPWLREDWEDGTDKVMHFNTEHLDQQPVVTQQVSGFMTVDGVRRYARKVLVTKGADQRVQARLLYDYLG